ncbi:hypothetical protein ACHAWF_004213 [Thalassiosira exigua]
MMSDQGQRNTSPSGEGPRNPNGKAPRPETRRKNRQNEDEHATSSLPVYWSVLHHKNVNEGASAPNYVNKDDDERNAAPPRECIESLDVPKEIVHERQPLLEGASSQFGPSSYDAVIASPLDGTDHSPPPTPRPQLEGKGSNVSKWKRVGQAVKSHELLIRRRSSCEDRILSDLPEHVRWEFTLRECLGLVVALLAIGAVAYSFVFERWNLIDSIYFTTILLTTVGYGDMTPSTAGGKLFATVFALVGVVVLGLALGVLGSRLVEAEVHYAEKIQSKTSKALEVAFARGARRRRKLAQVKEAIIAPKPLFRSLSSGSLESSGDSVRSCDSESACSVLSISERYMSHHHENEPKFVRLAHHLKTIGFGDITPSSHASKICAILLVPIFVATMGYVLGNIAAFIVEERRSDYIKRLWSKELTMEDIFALDKKKDGGVSEVEYIGFMLVAMKKIDSQLLKELRNQFQELDMNNDGQITKQDLAAMSARKMKKVSNKLKLAAYKVRLILLIHLHEGQTVKWKGSVIETKEGVVTAFISHNISGDAWCVTKKNRCCIGSLIELKIYLRKKIHNLSMPSQFILF